MRLNQRLWQWLTLVSSPTPTLLFSVVRNGALIRLCLLIHILWRKKLGLPPRLPSSKSGNPSQHRLCRMRAVCAQTWPPRPRFSRATGGHVSWKSRAAVYAAETESPQSPTRTPARRWTGPAGFSLSSTERKMLLFMRACLAWDSDHYMTCGYPALSSKRKKNKGAGETGLVLFLALALLHFSQQSVRIWNVSLLNQKAKAARPLKQQIPKANMSDRVREKQTPLLHMMEPLSWIPWFSQGGSPGSTNRRWGQGGWNRGLLKQVRGTFLQACLRKDVCLIWLQYQLPQGLLNFISEKYNFYPKK